MDRSLPKTRSALMLELALKKKKIGGAPVHNTPSLGASRKEQSLTRLNEPTQKKIRAAVTQEALFITPLSQPKDPNDKVRRWLKFNEESMSANIG